MTLEQPPRPAQPEPHTEPIVAHELGFGTRIADDSRYRLLNQNGTFNVRRDGIRVSRVLAPYHALLGIGWGRFLLLLVAFYVVANAAFAVGYVACGSNALLGPGSYGFTQSTNTFLRAFFFSVETFSTVGYGNIAPLGLAANVLVTVEAFTGLLSAALVTGLVFARFSRPSAAVAYSRNAVVAPYRGITAFMFRCANERKNQLINVSVRLMYSWIEVSNGVRNREFIVLPLEFDTVTFFALSWTVVHPIDESSPLHNCSQQDLMDSDAEFLVLLSGIDETFSQTVHSRTSYKAHEIVWDARFRPIFVESVEQGITGMDLSRINDIERY